MKLKHKLMIATSAVLMAAMVPVSALASVKVKIYGDRRVYGTETPFDTYIELKSTGYGLINNTTTIKLTLNNGKFATDSDGNYLPVYITDSKGETDRDEITSKLSDGSLYGFGFMPADDNYVKVTLPEDMIDDYAQIMFTATAKDYGDVTVSLSDNRNIKYIVEREDTNEKEIVKEHKKVEPVKVVIPIGSEVIYIGDEKLSVDVPAYVSGDITKIPLRAVSEIFDTDIYWNGAEKSVTIYAADDEIIMRIGDIKMYVNGYAVPLSTAPEISDGRTFLPLRDVTQIFGINDINWDAETKTVSFDYTKYSGHTYLTYNS